MILDRMALLAQAHFFSELRPSSRQRLAEYCIPRDFRKRATLFSEGAEGEAMYLLARGQVQLHKHAPDGTEVVIKVVRPGESFAEVVLFEQRRYPVTATALTDVRVYAIPVSAVRALLEYADFREDFLSSVMRRMRYLAERVIYLTACDVEDRLRRFLREQYGDAPVVQVAISKRDIARAIGATPETLSRVLRRLESDGELRWRGRRLERPAPRARRTTADSDSRRRGRSRAPGSRR